MDDVPDIRFHDLRHTAASLMLNHGIPVIVISRGYLPEEDPAWDKDLGAVGAILVGPDGRLYTAADPREETTSSGK